MNTEVYMEYMQGILQVSGNKQKVHAAKSQLCYYQEYIDYTPETINIVKSIMLNMLNNQLI